MKKILLGTGIVVGIIVVMAMVGGATHDPAAPSHEDLMKVAKSIMDSCEREALGHWRTPGEKIYPQQSSDIARCIDKRGGAYIETIEALQKP